MRKQLILILIILFSNCALLAQTPRIIQMSIVDIISPKQYDTLTRDGKNEKVIFSVVNHGPDTVRPYDCIFTSTALEGHIYQNSYLCPTRTVLPGDSIILESWVGKTSVWKLDTLRLFVRFQVVHTANTADPIQISGQKSSMIFNTIYYINNIQPGFAPQDHQELNLYPNPASTRLGIMDLYGEVDFELFDINGKKILGRKEYCDGTLHIDVSHLPSGMYILKATSQGKHYSGRFVKGL